LAALQEVRKGGRGQSPFCEMGNVIQPLWAQCPGMTRRLLVGYPVLSLVLQAVLATNFGWLVEALFKCSVHSIAQVKVWTLFIGPFCSPLSSGISFLFMIFELYMLMVYFPAQETTMGSTTLLIWTLLMNGLVNTVFLIFMFVAGFYDGGYWDQSSVGLWPLIMVVLTARCLSDPQGSSSFWGLVQIPNKWYPLALVAFFSLLNGMRIMWNFIAALVIGYTYHIARYERFLPSKVRAARLENRCCCRGGRCGVLCGILSDGWIPATNTPGFEAESGTRRYATLGDFASSGSGSQLTSQNNTQPPSSGGGGGGNFTAFAGSGNRLGDGSEAPPASPPTSTPAPSAPPAPSTEQGDHYTPAPP